MQPKYLYTVYTVGESVTNLVIEATDAVKRGDVTEPIDYIDAHITDLPHDMREPVYLGAVERLKNG